METEEFSFPRINDTCGHNIDSPPLWNLSPAASPNPYQGIKGEEENEFFRAKLVAEAQRKSFSYVENCRKKIGLEEDERMDLLWEDFNEELYSTTGSASATSSSREVVEFRCVPSLTVANASKGALLPTRNKPGMVVIVKVIKKLFSINNSQGKPRKRVR